MSNERFYTSILKPINECYHTGTEVSALVEMIGEYAVVVYKDNVGNRRAVLMNGSEAVSGLLFDHTGEVRVRYTIPEERGQRLSRQLFAWVSFRFADEIIRHSQHLTTAGQKSI